MNLSSSTNNNSADVLDEFVENLFTSDEGFHLLSDFELPVNYSFGYVYDNETKRLYIAGGRCAAARKGYERHDKFFEIKMIQDDDTSSSSSSLHPRYVRMRDLPHGKGIHACACVKLYNKIYVIGGWDGSESLKDVYSFDTATGQWEKEASMNIARYDLAVTVTKGGSAIMVCGGQDTSQKSLDTCEQYNPTTKQWTILPSTMNEARYGFVSFCHESRVFVVGGVNTDTNQPLATTEVIDLDTSYPQWNFGPQMVEKRGSVAGCLVGDYVIVGGGHNGNISLQSCEAIATSEVAANNTGQWRLLHGLEMNKTRYCFGTVLVDNYLVALSGRGSSKTYETLDVSLLLQRPAAEPSQFYRMLFQQDEKYTMEHRLRQMAAAVGDVHEAKVFYTYAQQCVRHATIDQRTGRATIKAALETCAETCRSEDSIVMFVLILDKAEVDRIIGHDSFIRFKNRAELKRVGAVFIAPMREAINNNTRRIEGLERSVESLQTQILKLHECVGELSRSVQQVQQNVQKVNQGLQTMRRGFARRRKQEAAMNVISAVINAFSMGVGGNLIEAFENVVRDVVDFGDGIHMLKVIDAKVARPETEQLGEAYTIIKAQFEMGMQLAQGESEEVLADAIADGNAVHALAAIATLAYEEYSEAQEDIEEMNNNINDYGTPAEQTNTSEGTAIPDNFRDALLSEEDENQLPLHAAVKFADIDTLKELLPENEDVSTTINEVDSQGRTALDLAALTGQPEMVQVLSSKGGSYLYGSIARMRRITRSRTEKHSEYLEYIDSLV